VREDENVPTMQVTRHLARVLLFAAVALAPATALAAEYWLCADEMDLAVTGAPAPIPMWAFAADDDMDLSNGCGNAPTIPGPELVITPPDTTLLIHLRNDLDGPGSAVLPRSTSIVVAGLEMPVSTPCAGSPVWTDGSSGPRSAPEQRVRSMGCEAAAAPGSIVDYRWSAADGNAVPAGTYLYESGTHQQVQVQMGLYGVVRRDFGPGQAYDPTAPATSDTSFDSQETLVFSEIDDALHAAVDAGTYGIAPGPTSTLEYQPRYFLIDGQPFTTGAPCLTGSVVGEATLLRLVNAGSRQLVPTLLGGHWRVIAEGGSAYPFAKDQYGTLLMPGSTSDVIFTPPYVGTYRILERRLSLTNSSATNGGMQTCLAVAGAPPNLAPIADPDPDEPNDGYVGVAGIALALDGTASSDPEGAPLAFDWDFGDGQSGTGATPTHVYAAAGSYTVTLVVSDGGVESAPATTAVVVAGNAPPTANAGGPYAGRAGFPIAFSGSGSDPEAEPLTFAWDFSDPPPGAGAAPQHTFAAPGVYAVTLSVSDGFNTPTLSATTATVTTNTAPVASVSGPGPSVNPTVLLDGCASSDADMDSLGYAWNFGDGVSETTATCTVSHTYTEPTTFTVTLVVNDGYESSAPATTDVTIISSAPNVAPVAVADAFNPNEVAGTAAIAAPGVLANDTDADGSPSPLVAQFVSADERLRNLILTPDGRFTWSPGEPVSTTAPFQFVYRAFDGADQSSPTTVSVTREIRVKKVEYIRKPAPQNDQWRIEGTSSLRSNVNATLPPQYYVTVYLGPSTAGPVIGTARVLSTGVWKIQQNVPNGTVGEAGGSISADNLGTTTDCPEAPVCGAVLDVPIRLK
jgi:PKD repeat protein/FtsP/CotA-like multicopper oxidase with cupredoxin domain